VLKLKKNNNSGAKGLRNKPTLMFSSLLMIHINYHMQLHFSYQVLRCGNVFDRNPSERRVFALWHL